MAGYLAGRPGLDVGVDRKDIEDFHYQIILSGLKEASFRDSFNGQGAREPGGISQ